MRRVLVTGGAGYIGSVLCRMLLERGLSVRVLDALYFGGEPLRPLQDHPQFELLKGDVRNLDRFPELFSDVDAVVHLAGLANDPSCDLNPDLSLSINLHGTLDVAKGAIKAGVQRFIFASSCSVYGTGTERILTETSPLNPVSLYARTKTESERELLRLTGPEFCPVCLRQATVFGLSPRMRFDLAINLMTLHGIRKRKIFVMGGGRQWRPFVHVRDAARAFIAALEAPSELVSGQIFNVGNESQNYQILDLAQLVQQRLKGIEVILTPDDVDRRDYKVAFGKIRERLGFQTKHGVDEGIDEIAAALREDRLPDPEGSLYFNVRLMKEHTRRPAIEGGEPVRSKPLMFSVPSIGEEEIQEVVQTLRSGWITTGPRTTRFENDFKEYLGVRHAIAVSSCTAALHLSLVQAGIGLGDEVITSPITFPSTANAILYCGAKPIFVDVEPDTLNIDCAKIEAAITPRTKALLPVHLAGQPCDMKRIRELAVKHGLTVIEDAAHALGAEVDGVPIGRLSEFSCFSFYPIKNMTTIEGGMVTTEDDAAAEHLRLLLLHGMSRDAWMRYSDDRSKPVTWETVCLGFKYNMTDVQAAVGIHQLRRLEGFLRTRERYATIYRHSLADVEGLATLRLVPGVRHAHHLFIGLLDTARLRISRNDFLRALKEENINSGIHFRSLHLQPFYRETFGFQPDDFPVAAKVSEQLFSLPLYPAMEEGEVHQVIEAVAKLCEFYRA